jgi:hypothetical protein
MILVAAIMFNKALVSRADEHICASVMLILSFLAFTGANIALAVI